jgi:hypothetical protein
VEGAAVFQPTAVAGQRPGAQRQREAALARQRAANAAGGGGLFPWLFTP